MAKNTNNISKEERDLEIGKLYFYGYSQQELANRYKVSRATVRRAIDKYRLWRDAQPVVVPGRPIDSDPGQPMYDEDYATKAVPAWATYSALAILAGLAGFTGYILYNVFN